MESWGLLQSPAADAATNMAVDAALLRLAPARNRPLLRVYSWRSPAVSIGYFQNYPAELADQYEIVRRPTGGGIVYHVADTTYTLVVPPAHRLFQLTTSEAYCAIHRAVATALAGHVPATIALDHQTPASRRGTYACFQNPVAGDVVAGSRKLAGGAQRRNRNGVLHQGSIDERLSAAELAAGFQREFGVEFTPYILTDLEQKLAAQLAREKFSRAAWTKHL